ncbi:amine oxidase [Pseudomonas sp. M47T1]|uniref:flavin monoamine oxidase family protein n=1 Tax=Pseudomonas sp. M47T1 TaxID=1179778 RepID=UPI0002606E90|nr:FAD-dependent oxidoreductase [Pseudomonas sp. M47T1]EIK98296.1 amine oxidase [Pseudomonas sp. M47T1]
MTIGSSYDYPAKTPALFKHSPAPWAGRFPGPPDLCFDYRRLVEQPGGIASATQKEHKICIVGAGVTGLTAARELLRCGFTDITLIEQSRRIGGRHLTLDTQPSSSVPSTPFEMGAMRMPLFNRVGEHPRDGRSLMAYYASQFDLKLSDFPNPGTPWVASTGIYLREGQVSGEGEPTLLIWKNPEGTSPPPTATLQNVYEKWHAFAKRMTDKVAAIYGTSGWEALWAAIVARYEHMSFRQLVTEPAIEAWAETAPGDFGGLGMSADESAIFYSIGIGDGSWGAFYDVCCLYPLRTAIFGFSSHLQLVHGRVNEQGVPLPAPYLGTPSIYDTEGLKFERPTYIGLVAMDECLMFMGAEQGALSFYDHCLARGAGLLTDSRVTGLTKLENGKTRVHFDWHVTNPNASQVRTEDFDSVIVTLPSWIIETRIQLSGFTQEMLPHKIITAYKTAHWETSCKVYVPLKKSFLSKNTTIPQILVTDSFVHDVYAYRYNEAYAYDCLLLSYTWEDDATKLATFNDVELVRKCAAELDRMLMRCSNIQTAISPYLDLEHARVQRWVTDQNALGCAKLYRAGAYGDAVSLMAYNREYAGASGVYFSGESFSVDAGWTEPALRGAIDAVIHICDRTGATFHGGFSLADYPQYRY